MAETLGRLRSVLYDFHYCHEETEATVKMHIRIRPQILYVGRGATGSKEMYPCQDIDGTSDTVKDGSCDLQERVLVLALD